jgi:HD-GYP domain-containing protein (c-di-GMP phosphodiesterase class II)
MATKTKHEIDVIEKVKLDARNLRLGMYVCEVDRPWLETPFLFQGFEIKTQADLDAVRQHCEYVYIDQQRTNPARGQPPLPAPAASSGPPKPSPLSQEVGAARTARKQTTALLRTMVDDIRFGSGVDIQLAKDAVSDCVASILRNPDAMIFLTQMHAKGELISDHAMNTCVYAILVGRLLGLEPKALEELGTCGLVHDLGKVMVPSEILNKPYRLAPEEIATVQRHARFGRDILMSGRNIYSGTVDVAYGHHENLDGSGYPRGLDGSQLNRNCRIVAIVEKYDAIVSPRAHRPARSHLDALNVLNKRVRRNQLDPEIMRCFASYLGAYPPGTIVGLSSGEKAIVLETNPAQRLRPRLLVVRDAEQNPTCAYLDLAIKREDALGAPLKISAVHPPGSFGIDLEGYQEITMQAAP